MTPSDFQDEPPSSDDSHESDDSLSGYEPYFGDDKPHEHPETETLELETPVFSRVDDESDVEIVSVNETINEDDVDSDTPILESHDIDEPINDMHEEFSDEIVDDRDTNSALTPIIVPRVDDDYLNETLYENAIEGEFEVTAEPPSNVRNFEDLTLSELVGQFFTAPRRTWGALLDVLNTPSIMPIRQPVTVPAPSTRTLPSSDESPSSTSSDEVISSTTQSTEKFEFTDDVVDRRREAVKLIGYLVAFGFACVGNWLFIRTTAAQTFRTESSQLVDGIPWLIFAVLIWLIAELYGSFPQLKHWWNTRREKSESTGQLDQHRPYHNYDFSIVFSQNIPLLRVGFMWGAVMLALLTWVQTSDNRFTFLGAISWIASIVLVILSVAPAEWNIFTFFSRLRISLPQSISFQKYWTTYALIAIVLLGAWFRFTDFSGTPPEMTSDHVEKLLDANRVFSGEYQVFFANNGGREPFQMYALALMSNIPGLNFNHDLLLLLADIESLLTLPLLFWMGREVVGKRDRRLGTIVGLILAGLVAVSYWHTSITRLALRIVLTPLVASLLVIYLSRGMRENRRADFIKAGMVLGFGLYTYQAVRMLPVVVLAGVFFAFIRNFRRPQWRTQYILHLAVLVIVAFVIFVPLARYWNQSPESFWRRTSGRLLGDGIITETDEAGNIVERNATVEERLDAFSENFSVLASNIRNALLMYNWKGDVGWINGAPNYPVMDVFTGSLLIIGLAAWLVFMIKSRDAVIWLMPMMVFIMLLPSALSIAMPIENPSATRTSGSLPAVYLIASLPLSMIVLSTWRVIHNKLGVLIATCGVVVILMGALIMNSDTYFNRFRESYLNPSLPYTEAGDYLEGFAHSNGSYGNAFIIAYQYWWDHRAVGIEAGIMDYANGIVNRGEVPDFVVDTWRCADAVYRLDPERDLLFFYHQEDLETHALLQEWFPAGRGIIYDSYQDGDDFRIYTVPALGVDGMVQFMETFSFNRRCN